MKVRAKLFSKSNVEIGSVEVEDNVGVIPIAILLACMLLVGCSARIKYESCTHLGECKVSAEFDDWHSCEFYKKYQFAYCDSVSKPGFAICRFEESSVSGTARCTR